MKDVHKQKLKKAYNEKRLIPFIGAGLSAPFKIPTWGELLEIVASRYVDNIYLPTIKAYIKNYKYWDAIHQIKQLGVINEITLQKEICDTIKNYVKINKSIPPESHNYSDLASLKVNNYITTNYDSLLYEFLPTKSPIAQVLYKMDICSQLFFEDRDEPRIWHLHGHINDTGSIVISKEKYDELYLNGKYIDLFKLLQGNGTFLFVGFSFKDHYIQELLEKNNLHFNSEHFIILDNPSQEEKEMLTNKYGLMVIEYDSEGGKKHTEKIREIINCLSEDQVKYYQKSGIKVDTKKPISITQVGFEEKFDAKYISNISFHPIKDCFIYSLDNRIMLKYLKEVFPSPIGENEFNSNFESRSVESDNYLVTLNSHLNIYNEKKTINDIEEDTIDLISIRKYHEKYTCKITDMAFSPCGKYIATVDGNGYFALWDFARCEIITHFLAHDDAISSVRFSPDYHYIATASFDETIKIWEIKELINKANPICLRTMNKDSDKKMPGKYSHEIECITALAFSKHGDFLASGDQKGLLKIRSVFTKAKNDIVYKRQIHNSEITDIVFSPISDNIIYTASADSRIRITKKNNIWESITLGVGDKKHIGCVNSIAISSDGQILLSSGADSIIKLWNVSEQSLIMNFETGHSDSIHKVALCPKYSMFASDCLWDRIKLWEITNEGDISNTTIDIKN